MSSGGVARILSTIVDVEIRTLQCLDSAIDSFNPYIRLVPTDLISSLFQYGYYIRTSAAGNTRGSVSPSQRLEAVEPHARSIRPLQPASRHGATVPMW